MSNGACDISGLFFFLGWVAVIIAIITVIAIGGCIYKTGYRNGLKYTQEQKQVNYDN